MDEERRNIILKKKVAEEFWKYSEKMWKNRRRSYKLGSLMQRGRDS